MKNKVRMLYEIIVQKRNEYLNKAALFGSGDMMCILALRELEGMEEAFKIVAGMDTVDYMLKDTEG